MSPVGCKRCSELLADYRDAVSVLTDAGRKFQGPARGDFPVALKELKRLRQACKDADDALIEHWRQEHPDFTPAGSS